MHRRLSFCVEDVGMSALLGGARADLIDFGERGFSGLELLIIFPIINSDCGARADDLKGSGQRDRRIRLMPTRLVFCTLFLRYFLNSLDSLLLPRLLFSVCGSLGTSGTVRSSDVNGLPQDRPLRLGRIDSRRK